MNHRRNKGQPTSLEGKRIFMAGAREDSKFLRDALTEKHARVVYPRAAQALAQAGGLTPDTARNLAEEIVREKSPFDLVVVHHPGLKLLPRRLVEEEPVFMLAKAIRDKHVAVPLLVLDTPAEALVSKNKQEMQQLGVKYACDDMQAPVQSALRHIRNMIGGMPGPEQNRR